MSDYMKKPLTADGVLRMLDRDVVGMPGDLVDEELAKRGLDPAKVAARGRTVLQKLAMGHRYESMQRKAADKKRRDQDAKALVGPAERREGIARITRRIKAGDPGFHWVWVLFFEHNGAKYNLVQDFKLAPQDVARAAAWRWYEARVELYNILRKLNPPREFWPRILTWSDQQWIEVHNFLIDNADVIALGAADTLTFPQVLR